MGVCDLTLGDPAKLNSFITITMKIKPENILLILRREQGIAIVFVGSL